MNGVPNGVSQERRDERRLSTPRLSTNDKTPPTPLPGGSDPAQIWEQLLEALKPQLTDFVVYAWFRPIEAVRVLADGALEIDVPAYIRGWWRERYLDWATDVARRRGIAGGVTIAESEEERAARERATYLANRRQRRHRRGEGIAA